ncbi:MAG: hypothetical protein H0U27_13255 [Nitrosopumilus sp.]|nr:hypothetical protein [Nitrosopumilus sp.]
MISYELNVDEYLEPLIELMVEDDSYYRHLETPLKNAATIKNDHRTQMKEFFEMNGVRSKLENAQNLISHTMSSFVSKEIFEKIKNEMEQSADHLMVYIDSMGNESNDETSTTFQEIFGLSNDSLLHIYEFSSHLVRMGNFTDAHDLFLFFLITLSPQTTSFWIGQGVCLQALKQYEEALAVYNAVKSLNPLDPTPFVYSIEIYKVLKEKDKENLETTTLENIGSSLDPVALEERKNNH